MYMCKHQCDCIQCIICRLALMTCFCVFELILDNSLSACTCTWYADKWHADKWHKMCLEAVICWSSMSYMNDVHFEFQILSYTEYYYPIPVLHVPPWPLHLV